MATSGLVNPSVQVNSAGLDDIINNERSRATVTPITLSATVGTPTTYQTNNQGCMWFNGFGAPRTLSTSSAVTLSAGDLLTSIITINPGTGITATFDTATNLVNVCNTISSGVQVGDVISCLIVNGATSANTITLGLGSGGSFDTNQSNNTIPAATSKWVQIRFTNVSTSPAYTVYF
jgi:hypothetical protein